MNSVARFGRLAVVSAMAGVLAFGLGACGGGKSFKALDINVASGPGLSQSGRVPTVRVEFVGLTPDEAQSIGTPDPRQWFAGAPARTRLDNAGMIVKRQISQSNPTESLKASDPIWATWRKMNVRQVLIIADPPTSVAGSAATDWVKIVEAETQTWVDNRVTATLDNGLLVGTRVPTPAK